MIPLAREIAQGLIAAHSSGIWHCDLKPGNVLMDQQGHCRLIDFGLARWALDADSPHGGTLGYLAPEQISSAFGPISERTDVFGLGGILYALLTGRSPHLGRDLPETILKILSTEPVTDLRAFGVPEPVCQIVTRALHKDPDARWPNITLLAHELDRIHRATGISR